jgi:UDP-N-acetylglucosamine 2-epimerase
VDDPARLAVWLDALSVGRPVIFPIHPRTRATLARSGVRLPSNVTAIDPVGYLEMVALEQHAVAIATDSGGIQKEAYLAGVPCITLRTETEWVETVAAGWNRVVGDDPAGLRAALEDAAFMDRSRPRPDLYGDGRAAERMVDALERLHGRRAGGVRQEREPQPTEAAAS